MKKVYRLYLVALVALACVSCDQVTKNIAEKSLTFQDGPDLKAAPPRSYLGNVFRLQYAENTGAFLSMGADLPESVRTWLFTVMSGALLLLLFSYIILHQGFEKRHIFALSLILGGGFSNLIDRVVNDGGVVDFMNMGIGSLRTGIFNFADVAIMTGMGLVVLYSIRERTTRVNESEEGEEPIAEA